MGAQAHNGEPTLRLRQVAATHQLVQDVLMSLDGDLRNNTVSRRVVEVKLADLLGVGTVQNLSYKCLAKPPAPLRRPGRMAASATSVTSSTS